MLRGSRQYRHLRENRSVAGLPPIVFVCVCITQIWMVRNVKALLLLQQYFRCMPRPGRVCMHKVNFVVVRFSMTYRVLHAKGLAVTSLGQHRQRYNGFVHIRGDDRRILQFYIKFPKESGIIILEHEIRFYRDPHDNVCSTDTTLNLRTVSVKRLDPGR